MKLKIETPSKLKVGAFIKRLRKKFFLTQEEVSKKIGVSRPTYNKIEADKADITLDQAKRLADFFNVGIIDLLSSQDTANDNIRSALQDPGSKDKIVLDSSSAITKLSQCIHYIWYRLLGNHEFSELHIHKLIFLMEVTNLNLNHLPLFSLTYLNKKNSPIVLKYDLAVNGLLKNNKLELIDSDKYKFPNLKYLPLVKYDLSEFSAGELLIIEQIIRTFANGGVSAIDELLKEIEPLLNSEEEGIIDIYPH